MFKPPVAFITFNRPETTRRVFAEIAVGCGLLAKRELFEKNGYLKSEYFAYWEEIDFCIRF